MKKPSLAQVIVFTILFWIFGPQAVGQTAPPVPPVMPAQLGSTGSAFKAGSAHEGVWLAWRYTVNGVGHQYTLCATHDYQVIHPDTTGMTPIRTARAYWTANVTFDCKSTFEMRNLLLDATRAFE